ncbi:hypothetical protein BJX96DRAFT_172650 [Aspergillus floccosus]
MAPAPPITSTIIPSLPKDVYTFWFQHIKADHNLTLPTIDDIKVWFTRDSNFDHACVTQFGPALESIRAASPTADQLLDLIQPSSPQDWLGLVLLLDQLPRNSYRDGDAAVVFEVFDPLALGVAMRAIQEGVPTSPGVKYRLALRKWFYLPLMHSEDMKVQELCAEMYRRMAEDVDRVVDGTGAAGLNAEEAAYASVLAKDPDAARASCALDIKFEDMHRDIIARFGRYPHRNKALGRVSTPEEEKFLQEENQFA